jgi:hypothetical protein
VGETLSSSVDSLVTELLPDIVSSRSHSAEEGDSLDSEKLVVLGHSLRSTRSTSLDLTALLANILLLRQRGETYPVLRPTARSAM